MKFLVHPKWGFVLFSENVQHEAFAKQLGGDPLDVYSAGSVRDNGTGLVCFGESTSLHKSAAPTDTVTLRRMLDIDLPPAGPGTVSNATLRALFTGQERPECPLLPYQGEIETARGRTYSEDQIRGIWKRIVESKLPPAWYHTVPAVPWDELILDLLPAVNDRDSLRS